MEQRISDEQVEALLDADGSFTLRYSTVTNGLVAAFLYFLFCLWFLTPIGRKQAGV